MKMHLSFSTDDLQSSVAFYTTLLGSPPVKRHDDYALFITEQPSLELALDVGDDPKVEGSTHYGIVVDTEAAVDGTIRRLQRDGVAVRVERDETCCYATQTKVWATDPNGRPWEVYTVLAESSERDGDRETCCT